MRPASQCPVRVGRIPQYSQGKLILPTRHLAAIGSSRPIPSIGKAEMPTAKPPFAACVKLMFVSRESSRTRRDACHWMSSCPIADSVAQCVVRPQMPSGLSHGEHSPQQLTLAKRERQLQRALAQMAPVHKLHAAAEHVRAAQLLVLKAHAENIRYSPTADPKRLGISSDSASIGATFL